jgi:ubiquinone biosynthesis protein COQ4
MTTLDSSLIQKRDWPRAFRAIRVLIRDSERTDQVFDILDALEGPTNERGFREFVSHPDGRQLLEERPDLLATLSDHAYLASLPEGSFGRAYLAFMQEAGLSAQGLVDAELDREGANPITLDPDRRWLSDRGRDSHDLCHVLTGYGRDEAGEGALLAFTFASYPSWGVALIVFFAMLIGPKTLSLRWERYLVQAWRRGRAAKLDFARYEQWLLEPLEEVRRRAGIIPPEVAHPGVGIIIGGRDAEANTGFFEGHAA